MKKVIAESLGTVHTHTHTLCLLNKEINENQKYINIKR